LAFTFRCNDDAMDASADGTRDRDTIERELRRLVSVRSAYRERGGVMPPISQMDDLLDELLTLGPPIKPKPKVRS
jgi:hypothetical protein